MKSEYIKNQKTVILVLLLLFSFNVKAEKLVVYTVNYPLQYFAQRIGGEYVSVHFPAPKKVDPAFWMPEVKIINAYQQADLILLNGAGYAKWVSKVSLPKLRMVDTSKGFKNKYIAIKNSVSHQHGPGGEHVHAGTAFTTWLDLNQAAQQASAILKALIRKVPEQESKFIANYKSLANDLMLLDKKFLIMVSKKPSNRFIASHPIYQYLIRRYNLNMSELMWEPDEYPSNTEWNALASLENIKWMVWEDQPMKKTVNKLSELGVSVITFRPCMNTPEEGDFISVMKDNVELLAKAYN